jgi:hypothetical protein
MPVPLPDADHVLLVPPSAVEVGLTARGVATAVAPPAGLTELQRVLLESLFVAMTGHPVHLAEFEPMTAAQLGEGLRPRNLQFRTRIVQLMLLGALILRPLPAVVVDRVAEFALELGVDDQMIAVAGEFAAGSLGLAAFDFERNGYTASWAPDAASELHTSKELGSAWDAVVHDPDLAERWSALGGLPTGTLGRAIFNLYQARGFSFPGTPGSAPPLLAQHDWVHVLADYGTTVESELEVFAFIARANDDMRAFSLLAMVVSLFETGYLRSGAGLFESDTGHISAGDAVVVRIADAMRRGALCRDRQLRVDSIDFLRMDWFALADRPVHEVRERFSVPDRSAAAVEAGSVGPWEAGGISPFQLAAGRALAERETRAYSPHGAMVAQSAGEARIRTT